MRAVLLVARSELRHRWPALVGLAVIVGLVAGVVLTVASGARRTSTVLDRFLAETSEADMTVGFSRPRIASDTGAVLALADEISALDGVDSVAPALVVPAAAAMEQDFALVTGPDDRYTRLFGPHLLEGRFPDPDSVSDVMVNETAAVELDLGVGDALTVPTFTIETGEALFDGELTEIVPDGPVLSLDVVGIFRRASSFEVADSPMGIMSPAASAHVGETAAFSALFMLDGDADSIDVDAATSILQGAAGDGEFWTNRLDDQIDPIRTSFDSLATGLYVFAAVGAAAGVTALAHAVSRQVALSESLVSVTHALGMTRRAIAAATALPAMLAAAVGAVLGAVVSICASGLFPRSIARRAEIAPGIRPDWVVLAIGCAAVVAVVTLFAMTVARRQSGPRAGIRSAGAPARGRGARALLPPPVSLGVDAVIGGTATRRSVRAGPAVLGAVVGVAGIVAIATFTVSQREATEDPSRFGWTWDVGPDLMSADPMSVVADLTADPRVAAVGGVFCDTMQVEGVLESGCTLMVAGGSLELTYLDGRAPGSPDEVALGGNTMRDLGVELGDGVVVRGESGVEKSLAVVGKVVLPNLDLSENDAGRGLVTSVEGFEELADEYRREELVLSFAPGADSGAAAAELSDDYPLDFSVYSYAEPPESLSQLGRLRPTLTALAVFMGVLGVVGLVHYLLLSVRRRRVEFAVLKSLGFVRSQIRTICSAQAMTVAGIGVAVGVPLGYVVGRWVWIASVDQIGMVDSPTVPWPTMAVVVVLAVSGAVALAVAPGWLAARRSAAELLRTE